MFSTIKVAAGIIWHNNQILISQRKVGQHLAGYWEFPGGKINPNETPIHCLQRELIEEIGIHIKNIVLFSEKEFQYPEKKVLLYFYTCEWADGVAQALDVEQIKWVSPQELTHFNFAPANQEVIQKIITTVSRGSSS